MSQKSTRAQAPAEMVVRDIRRKTRRRHRAEEKIRIVLEGLRGDDSLAALCRREGIAESLYYSWSKAFLEAFATETDQPIPSCHEKACAVRCHCCFRRSVK